MQKTEIKKIVASNRTLLVVVVNFENDAINPEIFTSISDIFTEFTPYMHDNLQVLYVRDSKAQSIDGELIGGNCYNRHELMVAVPRWPVDMQEFRATLYHELHHMARHQNVGYGKTLGGAVLSEGIATYYEEFKTDWSPPWGNATYSKKDVADAISMWDSEDYNHSEWFFSSERGRWVGYALGVEIVRKLYSDTFDLKASLRVLPNDEQVKAILAALNKETD
ncbi:MAG: DUF2268 domain-containing putative Zn-dependent protease [Candidatus Saccharimonadales bacterium]